MSIEFAQGYVLDPVNESTAGHLQEGGGAINAGESKNGVFTFVVLEFLGVKWL